MYRYPRIKRKRQKQKANLDKESIHMRSDLINKRLLFGYWVRERKTRLLIAIKNANRKAKETSKFLINYMREELNLIESLTLDNDPVFAEYKGLSESQSSEIFFCDPYKSYQKGAIENGNRD